MTKKNFNKLVATKVPPYNIFYSTQERYHGILPEDKIITAVTALIQDRDFQKEFLASENTRELMVPVIAKALSKMDDESAVLDDIKLKGKAKQVVNAAIVYTGDVSKFNLERGQRRLLVAYSSFLSHKEYARQEQVRKTQKVLSKLKK